MGAQKKVPGYLYLVGVVYTNIYGYSISLLCNYLILYYHILATCASNTSGHKCCQIFVIIHPILTYNIF